MLFDLMICQSNIWFETASNTNVGATCMWQIFVSTLDTAFYGVLPTWSPVPQGKDFTQNLGCALSPTLPPAATPQKLATAHHSVTLVKLSPTLEIQPTTPCGFWAHYHIEFEMQYEWVQSLQFQQFFFKPHSLNTIYQISMSVITLCLKNLFLLLCHIYAKLLFIAIIS